MSTSNVVSIVHINTDERVFESLEELVGIVENKHTTKTMGVGGGLTTVSRRI